MARITDDNQALKKLPGKRIPWWVLSMVVASAGLAFFIGAVQSHATFIPQALKTYGFRLKEDFAVDGRRFRIYTAPVGIEEVRKQFIEEMADAGWPAQETRYTTNTFVVVRFTKSDWMKGGLCGYDETPFQSEFTLTEADSFVERVQLFLGIW